MSADDTPEEPKRPATGDSDAHEEQGELEEVADLDIEALEDLEVEEDGEDVRGGTFGVCTM